MADDYEDVAVGASPDVVKGSMDILSKNMSVGLEQPISSIDANVARLLDVALQGFSQDGGVVDSQGLTGGAVSTIQMSEDGANSLLSGIRDIVKSVALENQRAQAEAAKETTQATHAHTRPTDRQTEILSAQFSKEDMEKVEQHKRDQQQIDMLAGFQKQLDSINDIEHQRQVLEEQGAQGLEGASDARIKQMFNEYMTEQQASATGENAEIDRRSSVGQRLVNTAQSGNLQKSIKSIGNGDISGALGSLGKTLGSSGSGEDAGSGLAGVLGDLGLGAAGDMLGSLGGLISGIAAPVAAVTAGLAAYGEAQNVIGGLNATAKNQGSNDLTVGASMKAQSALTGFTTGLTDKQAEQVQSELSNNYSKYGTDEYNQGYTWSVNQYATNGIDPNAAAKMYTNMIVKGTSTMADLNETMSNFQETTQNTDLSLQQVQTDFTNVASTLTKAEGGNTSTAEAAASELSEYSTTGSGEQSQMLSGVISQFSTSDVTYTTKVKDYINQGKDKTQAQALAAFDLLESNSDAAAQSLQYAAVLPLDTYASGKTFMRLFSEAQESGNWDELTKELTDVVGGKTSGNGDGVVWENLVSDLTKMGVPTTYTSSSSGSTDKTVSNLIGYLQDVSGSLSNISNGTTDEDNESSEETAEGQTFGEQGWMNTIKTQTSLENAAGAENDTLNYSVSSGNFSPTNNEDKDTMLGILNQGGELSDDTFSNLTDASSKEMTKHIYSDYETYANDNDSAQSFTDWISGEGKDTVASDISKYSTTSSDSSTSKVTVSCRWTDDSAPYIKSKVDAANEQSQADSGDN